MLLSVINKLYLVSLAFLSWGFERPCHIVAGVLTIGVLTGYPVSIYG